MLFVLAAVVTLPLILGAVFTIARAKSFDRIRGQIDEAIHSRLESIAGAVSGTVVDGPALQTREGRLVLLASKAPQSTTIDIAKFTAPVTSSQRVHVIPVQDAGKAIPFKNLQAVQPNDATVASAYKIFASDSAFACALATPELVEKLQTLDRTAGVRSRLQLSPGTVTIVVTRELATREELTAFFEGCVDVLEYLRPHLGR